MQYYNYAIYTIHNIHTHMPHGQMPKGVADIGACYLADHSHSAWQYPALERASMPYVHVYAWCISYCAAWLLDTTIDMAGHSSAT